MVRYPVPPSEQSYIDTGDQAWTFDLPTSEHDNATVTGSEIDISSNAFHDIPKTPLATITEEPTSTPKRTPTTTRKPKPSPALTPPTSDSPPLKRSDEVHLKTTTSRRVLRTRTPPPPAPAASDVSEATHAIRNTIAKNHNARRDTIAWLLEPEREGVKPWKVKNAVKVRKVPLYIVRPREGRAYVPGLLRELGNEDSRVETVGEEALEGKGEKGKTKTVFVPRGLPQVGGKEGEEGKQEAEGKKASKKGKQRDTKEGKKSTAKKTRQKATANERKSDIDPFADLTAEEEAPLLGFNPFDEDAVETPGSIGTNPFDDPKPSADDAPNRPKSTKTSDKKASPPILADQTNVLPPGTQPPPHPYPYPQYTMSGALPPEAILSTEAPYHHSSGSPRRSPRNPPPFKYIPVPHNPYKVKGGKVHGRRRKPMEDEGLNEVWGGIPVRVARWRWPGAWRGSEGSVRGG